MAGPEQPQAEQPPASNIPRTLQFPDAVASSSLGSTLYPRLVRYGVPAASVVAILIGTFWLMVWFSGAGAQWFTGKMIRPATNTALGLALCGLALLLLGKDDSRGARQRIGAAVSILVLLIGALTLSEHLFHYNLGIDQLLATQPPGAVGISSPNRMGPPASLSFALLGAGLLALSRRRQRGVAPYVGIVVCLVNLFPLVGYLYGLNQLYSLPHVTAIAWPTLLGLMALGLGLVLAHGQDQPLAMLLERDAGGVLLRRLVPLLILVPLILGWLRLQGERLGFYDTAFGTGLLVIALVLLFGAGLWPTAIHLSRTQRSLRENREWLRVTLGSIGDAVLATDTAGLVIFVNPVAAGLTGWKPEEAVGQPIQKVFRIINEQTKVPAEDIVARVLGEGRTFELANHTALIAKDGRQIPIEDSAAPIRDSQGRIAGVVLVFHDVTEKRRTEEALRRQAGLLRLSFDAIIVWQLDGVIQSWNLGAERLYGFAENEALGRTTQELLATRHPKPWSEIREELVALGFWEGELLHRTRDGREVVVSARHQLIRDPDGGAHVLETNRDITESRRARQEIERARHDAEHTAMQLRSVVENMAERLYVCDANGRPILTNEAFRRTFRGTGMPEFPRAFAEAMEVFEMDGTPVQVADFPVSRALRGEKLRSAEYRLRLKHSGEEMINSYNASPVLDQDGKVTMAVFTSENITERKRSEAGLLKVNRALTAYSHSTQALLHAEDESALLDQVCGIVTEDCGYKMVWVGFADDGDNKLIRPVAYAGFEERYLEHAGITWADNERGRGPGGTAIRTGQVATCRNMLTDPQFLPWRENAIKRGYASSLVLPLILPSTHAAAASAGGPTLPCGKVFGEITIYSQEADPFSPEEMTLLSRLAADLAYGIGVLRLRTAHAEATEALRVSEERWATTLRSIGDAVISTDHMGRVVFMNEVAQKLTGWPLADAAGEDLDAVFSIIQEETGIRPESPVLKVLRSGRVVGLGNHTLLINRDGRQTPIEDSAAPIRSQDGRIEGVVLVFHDVSEQRKAEAALLRSEKLASVGRMAAAIAHEINNPLEAATNSLYIVQTMDDVPQSARQFLDMAEGELKRVAHITRQSLGFYRESSTPVLTSIPGIVDSAVDLLSSKIKTRRAVISKGWKGEVQVPAVAGELRQVFSNLLSNSLDAVDDQGVIKFRVSSGFAPKNGVPCVRVTIADNGKGIDTDLRPHVFEPFFTTKGTVGTGLGLWVSKQIVDKHGGTIRLHSRTTGPRRGTTISILLPTNTVARSQTAGA